MHNSDQQNNDKIKCIGVVHKSLKLMSFYVIYLTYTIVSLKSLFRSRVRRSLIGAQDDPRSPQYALSLTIEYVTFFCFFCLID